MILLSIPITRLSSPEYSLLVPRNSIMSNIPLKSWDVIQLRKILGHNQVTLKRCYVLSDNSVTSLHLKEILLNIEFSGTTKKEYSGEDTLVVRMDNFKHINDLFKVLSKLLLKLTGNMFN